MLPKLNRELLWATAVRICFLVYGVWQDENMQVKYTDVDYQVFTDAAKHVLERNSPYDRATYRYTPILAWMLTPNVFLHILWGKLCFVCGDLLTGYFLNNMLMQKKISSKQRRLSLALWLFNPFTITISTRGNAESILSSLVIGTLYYMGKEKLIVAGLLYGTSVHFKIYPVVYSLPLYFSLHEKSKIKESDVSFFLKPTKRRLKFCLPAVLSFVTLTAINFALYGNTFLRETYLYHLTRKDARHNFSPYFYFLYLSSNVPFNLLEILLFFPQAALMLVISVKFFHAPDLPMCMFIQTFVFVTFNKVCTSQYFIWYLCFLPLIAHRLKLSTLATFMLMFFWFITQAIWLLPAYLLEFQNKNTFVLIWLASLLLFSSNVLIIVQMIKYFV